MKEHGLCRAAVVYSVPLGHINVQLDVVEPDDSLDCRKLGGHNRETSGTTTPVDTDTIEEFPMIGDRSQSDSAGRGESIGTSRLSYRHRGERPDDRSGYDHPSSG